MTFTCPTCTQARPFSEGYAAGLDDAPSICDPCWLASLSLTDTLRLHGLTHRPRFGPGLQGREVVDAAGAVVFEGTADATWRWLRGEVAA